ncbi:MAG: hypothetical protein MUF78_04940 [Candidatus Edwardsbacteria bacterium]|jgi:DNA-binding response OmpR family regulator|nr:hypothetical protein [Candidatus Edwardsbacteria bacterium]
MKIVIASNDRNVFSLLEQYLEAGGHELACAEVRAGLIGFVRSIGPDILVLHAGADGEDARNLCRAIKSSCGPTGCKVVLIGNDPTPAGVLRDYTCGADRVLTYPFKLSDLGAEITALSGSGSNQVNHHGNTR